MDCGCCYKTDHYYRDLMHLAKVGELRMHRDVDFNYYCDNFKLIFKQWTHGDLKDIFKCIKMFGEMPYSPRSHHFIRWYSYFYVEEPLEYFNQYKYEKSLPKRRLKK